MPRRPAIFRRIVQWVRQRISSGEEEEQIEQRRLLEERQQRLALELEINRRQRILTYNRWIERQRDIALRQTEGEGEGVSTNADEGPIVYRARLPRAPEALERVRQSLILDIRENGRIFKLDIVHVYDENGWHLAFGAEVILEQE